MITLGEGGTPLLPAPRLSERFGVDLGDTYGRIGGEDQPPERVYLALEEHYHTRLLAYALDAFDLTFQVVPPPFVMRQFVNHLYYLRQLEAGQ